MENGKEVAVGRYTQKNDGAWGLLKVAKAKKKHLETIIMSEEFIYII
jgi:hypothetical protein